MIALGIVVLALGAGASINRSIIVGGQVGEDTFHANQLADNAIEMMKGTQAYVFNGTSSNKSLDWYFGLNGFAERALIPYRSAVVGGENTYPISWCVDKPGNDPCKDTTSKIGNVTSTIGQDFTAGGAEVIAVNRDVATTEYRNTIDYLTEAGGNIPLLSGCVAPCYWDYFSRRTTIKKLPNDFLGTGGNNVTAYQVSVVVTNLRTSTKVTKTVLLTDFGSSGYTGANGAPGFVLGAQQQQQQQQQQQGALD
jgi:hypothetical protein